MLILIDNGHGSDTPGKCSPDRSILEWRTARLIASHIVRMLADAGAQARLLVPEARDIPLRQRVARVNDHCRRLGADNVRLVSVHLNAAGADGRWHSARGWSAFVAPGASAASRRMASALASAAQKEGLTVRRPRPGQDYWEQSLALCRDTLCPAVLTENLFMDSRDDAALLLQPPFLSRLARLTSRALLEM